MIAPNEVNTEKPLPAMPSEWEGHTAVVGNRLRADSCGCDSAEIPEAEFSGTYPTEDELKHAAELPVLDQEGNAHTFKSLYADHSQRHLIIFIRHFFCGVCQEYVRTLASTLPPTLLSTLRTPANLILICCGDPSLISTYVSRTGCPYTMYTDPSRSLYKTFGFGRTLSLGPKPEYVQISFPTLVFTGVYQGLLAGTDFLKGGDKSQIGGEMVFWKGELEWFHRMRYTRDHAEVDELRNVLHINDNERPPLRRRWTSPVKDLGKKISQRKRSPVKGLARRLSEKAEENKRGRRWERMGDEEELEGLRE